jgi:hypothetical protein
VTRAVAALLIFTNLALALLVQAAAPRSPRHSDREAYEYVGRHGFAPTCGWSIYCYRVLVPLALARLPGDAESNWRGSEVLGTATAGVFVSVAVFAFGGLTAAIIAAVLAQTSYGFAFTAYDPYTADPWVFAFAAAIAWCWFVDRPRIAWALGTVGVFAKETVALVTLACVIAAWTDDRARRREWIVDGIAVTVTLAAFHLLADAWLGWTVRSSAAADLAHGSWLALWWRNNPFLIRKLYLLFAPFGFGWLVAGVALPTAPDPLRRLAWGALLPFLALCYIQTPERALSNAFFVVVPLEALFLARAPLLLAAAAAAATGLVTLKVGSSTPWLPPSTYLLIPAAATAAAALGVVALRRHR